MLQRDSFQKTFQDWELEEGYRSLEYISSVKVKEGEDSLLCISDWRGNFRVKPFYNFLRAKNS